MTLVGYGDRLAPRTLVATLLGATSLGHYILAERVLEILGQVVLNPLSNVTMAAVAGPQADKASLQHLIKRLYGLSTLFGYPAFSRCIILVPALAELGSGRWLMAILPAQLLLLVGLRTTTGNFNLSTLHGVSQPGKGLVLLGLGFILQLALVPIGIRFWGVAGATAAVLARTYLTWPIGCRFVKQATGLPRLEQLFGGGSRLVAALITALAMLAVQSLTRADEAVARFGLTLLAGCVIYPAALHAMSAETRSVVGACFSALRTGGVGGAFARLKVETGFVGREA